MPGMAESNIAIDIASSASDTSEVHGTSSHPFAPRPRIAALTLGLIALDAVVTAGSAMFCYAQLNSVAQIRSSSFAIPLITLTVSLTLSFFERGLYAPLEIVSREMPWRQIVVAWFQAVAIGTLAAFCLAAASSHANVIPGLDRTGAVLHGAWLPAFVVVGLGALVGVRLLRLRFHAGTGALNRTVVIGSASSISDLLPRVTSRTRRGFDVTGIVEFRDAGIAEPIADGGTEYATGMVAEAGYLGVPLFRDLDALERMIRKDAVDTVLVALPWSASEQIRTIIQRISMAPVDVYIYPGMNGLDVPLRRADRAFDLPLLMACTRPIGGWGAFIKRAEDIVLSASLLGFISPVLLSIALAIKLTSRGPVFFRQRRLGYNNRVIEVLKFRSMYTHLSDADANQQTSRGDKRVTRVGAWLRKASLDELPQLLNVLRGDMSLVGPRPHALATTAGGLALEEAVPVYASRHRVKPGITGWAQVNGYRGALDSVEKIVHRVNHDLYYIENWSLRLDLKILWRTARLVFADDNAF